MMKRLWRYLYPMNHIGNTNYPILFPLITTLGIYLLFEFFSQIVFKVPNSIGNLIVFTNFALCLYFSFRAAFKGGLTVLILSILYYVYFIFSRQTSLPIKEMAAFIAGLLTLTNVAIVLFVAWLRVTLDKMFKKELEEKATAEHQRKLWETLLDQLPVGVIIATSQTGEIMSMNREAIQLLGKPEIETKTLQDYNRFEATRGGKKLDGKDWPLAQAILRGKTTTGEEIIMKTNKGDYLTLLFNAAPILNKEGKTIAAVTVFYDITKQKELDQHKDDFIAMASHELKTPLTSAKLYTSALGKADKGKVKALAKKIDGQIDKLSELVSVMLEATRIDQGKLQLSDEIFPLKPLALATIAEVEETLDRKITIDWKSKATILANKEKISQIFTNLITNAAKYSPQKSEIKITSEDKDGYALVNVQDFGLGLSGEEQLLVFDKFYQPKAHKTYPGIGLGLYISQGIVRLYGGDIWVKSEKDKGSTFSFSIPIQS